MELGLAGRRAIVTGGSKGIGQAIAGELLAEGAAVTICSRHADELETAAAELMRDAAATELVNRVSAGAAGTVLAMPCDVTQPGQVTGFIDTATAAMGGLDILVNNAGIEKNASFLDITEEDYNAVIAVSMSAAFFCTQSFARHRRDAKAGGKVINISSVHEELPFPHFTAYCMAKGGLKMMMRNLSIELAPLGITVNNVAPGAIQTPINQKLLSDPKLLDPLLANIPLKRLGQPADVAGVVAFLASSDADYITGATIVVDGGLLWNYSEQ
jgi:glucose 1-dehydrogenase